MNCSTLTTTEAESFAKLEERVEAGLTNFIDVGNALSQIRDAKLYRASHGTFEDYCRERWGMSRSNAFKLIDEAAAAASVDNCPQINRGQARELARVEPERRQEVVEKASAATGGKITAAALREAARTELVVEKAEAPVDEEAPPQPARREPRFIMPARGMFIARGAISELEKIQPEDSERKQALAFVIEWCRRQLSTHTQ